MVDCKEQNFDAVEIDDIVNEETTAGAAVAMMICDSRMISALPRILLLEVEFDRSFVRSFETDGCLSEWMRGPVDGCCQ